MLTLQTVWKSGQIGVASVFVNALSECIGRVEAKGVANATNTQRIRKDVVQKMPWGLFASYRGALASVT